MNAADEGDSGIHSTNIDDAPAQFRLRLVSFGRANGPLALAPRHQLLFSVRDIPSPPARLCKTHTGLSSHLRKEVMAGKGAGEMLAKIENSILQEMARLDQLWQSDVSHDGPDQDDCDRPSLERGSRLLQIGIFCEEGKHRSVSFVHELARCKRLKQQRWTISTVHRDLGISNAETELCVPTPAKVKKRRMRERKHGRSRRINSRSSSSGDE
jgi:RNase adaptor protein for sRNA GlmZ degradation